MSLEEMPGRVLSRENVSSSESESEGLASESSGSESGSGSSSSGRSSQKRKSTATATATATPPNAAKRAKTTSYSKSKRAKSTSNKVVVPRNKSPSAAASSSEGPEDDISEAEPSNGDASDKEDDSPPRSWEPPLDFTRVKVFSQINVKLQRLFSKQNLEGKEIWHITAPASVPMAALTALDLDASKKGNTIIAHGGSEYNFSKDSASSASSKLLVPGRDGDTYAPGWSPLLIAKNVRPANATPQ